MISVVSPVYRAENILETLVSELCASLKKIGDDFEIILIDDRSPDGSWAIMQLLVNQYPQLKIFRLSRNFGQHAAIMAGLGKARGEWIVIMDCDMQDRPSEIPKLYEKASQGYDVVTARRVSRQDSFSKKMSSALFYRVFNFLAGMEVNSEIANFGIYRRCVAEQVLQMGDYIKFFPLFVNWVGFRNTSIEIEHSERESGRSSYSLARLFSLAFNVIISFSDKPLKIFAGLGAGISIFSFFVGIFYFFKYLFGEISQPGYISIILSIWFLSGFGIMCIGILGIYLGKIFNQVKQRPVFIFDETE